MAEKRGVVEEIERLRGEDETLRRRRGRSWGREDNYESLYTTLAGEKNKMEELLLEHKATIHSLTVQINQMRSGGKSKQLPSSNSNNFNSPNIFHNPQQHHHHQQPPNQPFSHYPTQNSLESSSATITPIISYEEQVEHNQKRRYQNQPPSSHQSFLRQSFPPHSSSSSSAPFSSPPRSVSSLNHHHQTHGYHQSHDTSYLRSSFS